MQLYGKLHFLNGLFPASFPFIVDSKQMFDKNLPMTGFKALISGVGGNCSTNWATTTTKTIILIVEIFGPSRQLKLSFCYIYKENVMTFKCTCDGARNHVAV